MFSIDWMVHAIQLSLDFEFQSFLPDLINLYRYLYEYVSTGGN